MIRANKHLAIDLALRQYTTEGPTSIFLTDSCGTSVAAITKTNDIKDLTPKFSKVSGIYAIQSSDLQFLYIGKSKDLYERLRGHRRSNSQYVQAKMKSKPGIWTYYIIETCPVSLLDDRESYYWYKLNCNLNLVEPGTQARRGQLYKEVTLLDAHKNILGKYTSITAVAEHLGVSTTVVKDSCHTNRPVKRKYWVKTDLSSPEIITKISYKQGSPIRIVALTLDGKEITRFDSALKAAVFFLR
uniref:GIY-YIG endonuclease n=1 Tax=Powellomyces hirtus TaxID=109895 RepID=A0A4P8NQL3_9FUNG|nr:GIY-YIG endonuclease [Powellomyces hirtus]